MQRQIELLGAAWGLGGADAGCGAAPAALAPLAEARLRDCGYAALRGPILSTWPNERRKLLAVSRLCGLLASAVADSLRHGRLPCVIGGDHSCAGGTWTGVARTMQGNLGLLWIDAHMDSHTPGTSHTGRLHGMPLAWLLGQDDDPLYGLASGVLQPQHVCIVGVRSFEPEEAERLERLGVRVFHFEEVTRRGLPTVFAEALAIVTSGTERFGVSIDLDVITPKEVPHVGTPVADGLASAALTRELERLATHPALAAIELVEYSPKQDRDGSSARIAVDLLAAALCGSRSGKKPQVVADALRR